MLRIKSKVSTSFERPPQASGLFELSEIQKATKNFDESLVIGRGGFGNVYKGKFSNGDVAAIKRLNPESNQGATEFRAEVEMLSTLRHCNLVSMIGYCNHERDVKSFSMLRPWDPTLSHEKEMILLYEYMCNGTLKELLHEHGHHVSFADRLGICIGVGRGLDYLHTGTETGTIHRDIKSSNILFNENGTAKISDFGLSKIGPSNGSPSICTIPKGTIGYMDPDYYTCGRVTRKSDVYSFGVVMLELLCRKPALDTSRDDNQRSLVTWVQEFINKGEKMDIVDSDVREETSSEILNDFFRIVERCLHKCPDERPNMSEVVASLEMLQNSFNSSLRPAEIFVKGNSMSSSPGGKKFMFNDLKKATKGFSKDLSIGEGSDVKTFLGWVDRNTLAPSNHVYGIAVAVQRVTSEIPGVDIELPDDVNFLGQLAHPNIIRLLGCCIRNDDDAHEHLLVYEHMKKSLSHFIHGDEPLPWITRINIMIGVAHAMLYLFRIKGLLCHFKCNGILLDEDFNAKLGCFGWAKHNSEKVENDDRIWLNGVFGYLRADYDISTGHVMMKNDVFSFGLVLLETITGRPSTNIDLRDLLKPLERLKARATDIKSKRKLLKNIMDPRLKGSYQIEDAFKCVTLVLKCVAKQHADKPSREEILRSLEEIVASKR